MKPSIPIWFGAVIGLPFLVAALVLFWSVYTDLRRAAPYECSMKSVHGCPDPYECYGSQRYEAQAKGWKGCGE